MHPRIYRKATIIEVCNEHYVPYMVKSDRVVVPLQESSGSLLAGASLTRPFKMGEDDAASGMRLEDLRSSASAADAVNRLCSARAGRGRGAQPACLSIPESAAVAALEAAACSLAQNLKSVLARAQPSLPTQRSWSSASDKVDPPQYQQSVLSMPPRPMFCPDQIACHCSRDSPSSAEAAGELGAIK